MHVIQGTNQAWPRNKEKRNERCMLYKEQTRHGQVLDETGIANNSKIMNKCKKKLITKSSRELSESRDGGVVKSACLLPMWPGFDSRTRHHMWVEFVVGSRPCSEGFSPVFLPPQKPTFLNSNSTWNTRSSLKRAPGALWWAWVNKEYYNNIYICKTSSCSH